MDLDDDPMKNSKVKEELKNNSEEEKYQD
jgi:hypothetical protein